MGRDEETGGISSHMSACFPPGPGQGAVYKCRACGELFTRKTPLFFDFGPRCPKCGSFSVRNIFNPMEEIMKEHPPSKLLRSLEKRRKEKEKKVN